MLDVRRACGSSQTGAQDGRQLRVTHYGKTRIELKALLEQAVDLVMGTESNHLIALPMASKHVERTDANRPG
jgi:hypothetical protein